MDPAPAGALDLQSEAEASPKLRKFAAVTVEEGASPHVRTARRAATRADCVKVRNNGPDSVL